MKDKKLDALVFPTMLCPASPLFNVKDKTYVCSASDAYIPAYLASSTGFPEITLPMGFTKHGLPLGISFFATAYDQPRLIGWPMLSSKQPAGADHLQARRNNWHVFLLLIYSL